MSKGYAVTMGFGLVGIVFLTMFFGAGLLSARGADPMDVLDGAAVWAVGLTAVFGYGSRLIFWSKSPPSLRAAVQAIVSIVMVAIVVATAVGGIQLLRGVVYPQWAGLTLGFTVLSAISALIWLVRYNRRATA